MSYSKSESTLTIAKNSQFSIRILIVDSQGSSSKAIAQQVRSETDITVVGIAKSEIETFVEIESFDPNVVIIDFDLSKIDNCALIKKINDNFPKIKTIVLTERNQPNLINQALSLGATGFLIKNSQSQVREIASVLRAVTYDRSGDTKLQLPSRDDREVKQALVKYSNNSPELAIVHAPTELPAPIAEREDWSAATKDLLDALPKVWTRGLLYFLILGTSIILPWSIFTKVDQTGTARGRLEPKDKVIRLDAPVAGEIQSIDVKEGEKVKKGAILAQIGSEVVSSELEQLKDERSGLQQRLSQLELMRNQAVIALDTKEEETQSRLLEKQSQLAQARQNYDTLKALYESQKGEKLAQIEQAKEEINSNTAARKEAKLALSGAQEKAKRYEAAFKQGVISQDRFLDTQQEALENQERLAQATSALEQAKSRLKEQQSSYENLIKKSEAEIAQASLQLEEQKRSDQTLTASGKLEKLETKEQAQELESQIATLKTEIAQNDKQIESSQFQLKQRQLLAPADGIVFHIPAEGKGAVVQPGERIIEIAPENSTLILRAQIPPTDSGFLKEQMPVKIKFDAYPFQDYGITEGKLISISPDSKVTETPQGQQETYELKIELDKPYILDEGKRIPLDPGQTATAEVIIRQRRVIDFFIDPFKKLQEDGVKL